MLQHLYVHQCLSVNLISPYLTHPMPCKSVSLEASQILLPTCKGRYENNIQGIGFQNTNRAIEDPHAQL